MENIDFTLRMTDLRAILSRILRDTTETAASLAKKISSDNKTISDRAIREFVEDPKRALSAENYNLTIEYFETMPCRFDFQETFSSFVTLLTHVSEPINKSSSLESFRQTLQIEYERTYEQDKIDKLSRFINFLREDILTNLPPKYKLTDKEEAVINKYSKSESKQISFAHLVADSFQNEDGLEHGREIGSFADLFNEISDSLFIYANILPKYLLKNEEPQISLVIGTDNMNPGIFHTPSELKRVGLLFDQEKKPYLLRTFNKGSFFEPAKRSSSKR